MDRENLVNNLISGVYTNSDKYMARFTENWQEYYANLPLIYNVNEGKINENMERLRHKFIESGKRYWLFMDDDIIFNNNQVIEIALKTMQENDLALCSVYQTTDKTIFNNFDITDLSFENITSLLSTHSCRNSFLPILSTIFLRSVGIVSIIQFGLGSIYPPFLRETIDSPFANAFILGLLLTCLINFVCNDFDIPGISIPILFHK